MVQSTSSAPHVLVARLAVAAELERRGIDKSRENKHQHFMFRGVDDVMGAVAELLVEHKLVLEVEALDLQFSSYQTKKNETAFRAIVKYKLTFLSAVDGSSSTVVTYGEGADHADKATNKAQSYAYKDALLKGFCVPVEGRQEDRDPDFEDPQVGKSNPRQAPRAQVEKPAVVREQRASPATPAADEPAAEGPETIEHALERLVRDAKNRAVAEAKILQAYNAMHLGEIPEEEVADAIQMLENFVEQKRKQQQKK